MPKSDPQKRIDLRPRGTGNGVSVSYGGGASPPPSAFNDEELVRRDGTHSLYATAKWTWESGALVADVFKSLGNKLVQVVGNLFAGRRTGAHVGFFNYGYVGEIKSLVMEATDTENVPVFSAGALDNDDVDAAWVNIGREGYPRIHFGELAGWDRRVPLVDAELIVGNVQSWQVNYAELNPLLSHSLLQDLSSDDHTFYHNDERGDERYARLTHFHGAPEIYIVDAGDYFASAYLEDALAECAGYFVSELTPPVLIGGPDDYLQIDADGTLMLHGNATAWDDLRLAGSSARLGSTAPTLDLFGPSGSLRTLRFNAGQHDEIHFEIQMPHNWKQGSRIYPHVHWTPVSATAGNVVWQLDYTWANMNEAFGAPTTMVSDATAAGGTAWMHKLTRVLESGNDYIDGAGKTLSSMLVCRLHRDAGAGSDTLNADVAFLEFDLHYEVDGFGSKEEIIK